MGIISVLFFLLEGKLMIVDASQECVKITMLSENYQVPKD